jgi:hypothetical protein
MLAVQNAPVDERAVTDEERAALLEARADASALVPGSEVTAMLAARARTEG